MRLLIALVTLLLPAFALAFNYQVVNQKVHADLVELEIPMATTTPAWNAVRFDVFLGKVYVLTQVSPPVWQDVSSQVYKEMPKIVLTLKGSNP